MEPTAEALRHREPDVRRRVQLPVEYQGLDPRLSKSHRPGKPQQLKETSGPSYTSRRFYASAVIEVVVLGIKGMSSNSQKLRILISKRFAQPGWLEVRLRTDQM